MTTRRQLQLNGVNVRLPFWRLLGYGFQHVLAMYAGAIAVPLIIAAGIGLSKADTSLLIQCNLMICGIATIIQSLGIGRFAGIRLPVMMGITFTAVPPLLLFGRTLGLPYIFGAALVSGLAVLLIAPWFARIARFLPPLVIGSVITTIGVALIPLAIRWSLGGGELQGKELWKNGAQAALVILVIVLLFIQRSKLLSSFSVLIGFVIGITAASALGEVSLSGIRGISWFSLPSFFHFGWPRFNLAVIGNLMLVNLITMVESLGVFYTVSATTGTPIDRNDIVRGYRAEGLSIILGGLFNSFPNTTFSQNAGLIALSGVKSRYVLVTAGALLVVLGFSLPLAFLMASVPMPVIGGAAIVMFIMIMLAGVKILRTAPMRPWLNLLVPVTSVGAGIFVALDPEFFKTFPLWLSLFFGNSIATGSTVAVLVFLILRVPFLLRKGNMYSTRYAVLLKTFIRATDQKEKTVEAIHQYVLPQLAQRNTFADLGCGSGEIAARLIPSFQHAYLTDLDRSNIRLLEKKFGDHPGVTILRKDLNTFVPAFHSDLMLFSFSLGYVGLSLPERNRLPFRMKLLQHYFRQLNRNGKLVIVDTSSSGVYRNLFDFVGVPVHEEMGELIRTITADRTANQFAFDVTVKTATIEEMVLCLRLITYDDGTSYINMIPWYLEFAHALPREEGMVVFRYTTVLTVVEGEREDQTEESSRQE